MVDVEVIFIPRQNYLVHELFLPTQGNPLRLKGEDGRDETAYTDDSLVEVYKSERGGWEPKVQRVDDELFFSRCLGAVVKLSMILSVEIKLSCAYTRRPSNLAFRSTAELTFSSIAPCCKREISAVIRWALNAELMMLKVIPQSQYLLALLFTFCALSGDKLMNLIALAQMTAS